jgi:hypothetical protein
MTTVSWYAMTPALRTAERGPLDLAAAVGVIDDYLARLKPRYGTAETALAETMFGFCRGRHDFIEICLHTPIQISFTVELPRSPAGGLFAKLRGPFRREWTLDSQELLRRYVTAYFTMTPEQFRAHVQVGD